METCDVRLAVYALLKSMELLRTRIIRLAHARPDLRPHLLPLLRAAAKGPNLDPKMVLEALAEITKDPEKYGVKDTDTLDELATQMKKLLKAGGLKDKFKKKATNLADALKLAAVGFDAVGATVKAGRHITSDFPQFQDAYDTVLRNTLGLAYSAACLGTAAALSSIAPDHPIAKHAADYEQAMSHVDISTLEKMRDKTLSVVESMSDDEVEVSIGMMRKAVETVTGTDALPPVSDETIEASIKVHNSLQDLFGHFTGHKVQKPRRGDPGKRQYQDYAEEKKQDGGKPMAKEQWEKRFGPRRVT